MKTLLLLSLLFGGLEISIFGQTSNQPELFDQFSRAGCDEVFARVNGFASSIKSNPTATGYAIVSGSNVATVDLAKFELQLEVLRNIFGVDPARFILIRSDETPAFRASFWIVPAGAAKPDFKETEWDFALSSKSKAFRIDDDPGMGCGEPDRFEKLVVELLKANAGSRCNILICARNIRFFEKEKNAVLTGIPRDMQNRLKFFYKKDFSYIGDGYASREIWIVPHAKR
jgi:hypothetical protein